MSDDFDAIINQAKRIVGASTRIANDVFPKGPVLTCSKCGATQDATASQCARYLSTGWPEHCGRTMGASRR